MKTATCDRPPSGRTAPFDRKSPMDLAEPRYLAPPVLFARGNTAPVFDLATAKT